MFDVPFKYGRAWTAADDENRSAVVVLTREMNEQPLRRRTTASEKQFAWTASPIR